MPFEIICVTLHKISDDMRIIAKSTLVAYYTKNPQSKAALEDWGAQIKNEAAYRAALKRVEQLEELVDDDSPIMDENALELDMLIDMIEEYEDIHYPIGKPSLVDTIKLRLYEMGITQAKLAELLNISPARVSDIMRGKCEPTLKVARDLCQKLNISPAVVLGV